MGMPGCNCVPPDGNDWSEPWIRECDHHKQQRADLQTAVGALADIGGSTDMTLALARKKAKRIYRELTAPKRREPSAAD